MNKQLQAREVVTHEVQGPTDARKGATPLQNPSDRGTASAVTTNPSNRDVGGVVTDVVIETEQADLRQKREAVLKAIRRGQLATDLLPQK